MGFQQTPNGRACACRRKNVGEPQVTNVWAGAAYRSSVRSPGKGDLAGALLTCPAQALVSWGAEASTPYSALSP